METVLLQSIHLKPWNIYWGCIEYWGRNLPVGLLMSVIRIYFVIKGLEACVHACVVGFLCFIFLQVLLLLRCFSWEMCLTHPFQEFLWNLIQGKTMSLMYSVINMSLPLIVVQNTKEAAKLPPCPECQTLWRSVLRHNLSAWRMWDGEHLKGLEENISFLKHDPQTAHLFFFFLFLSFPFFFPALCLE